VLRGRPGHNAERQDDLIAITPDGKTAYVANSGDGHVDAHTVTPIRTATDKAGRGIPIGINAYFILIAR
jgi:DNA-binding beta-propeller fold protein YncE